MHSTFRILMCKHVNLKTISMSASLICKSKICKINHYINQGFQMKRQYPMKDYIRACCMKTVKLKDIVHSYMSKQRAHSVQWLAQLLHNEKFMGFCLRVRNLCGLADLTVEGFRSFTSTNLIIRVYFPLKVFPKGILVKEIW